MRAATHRAAATSAQGEPLRAGARVRFTSGAALWDHACLRSRCERDVSDESTVILCVR